MSITVAVVIGVVLWASLGLGALMYLFQGQPSWYKAQGFWMRIVIISLVTIVALSPLMFIVHTYHGSAVESQCLAWSLDRRFKRFDGIDKAIPAQRQLLKKEAELIAHTILKDARDSQQTLCDKKWEVWENSKSAAKGAIWRVAKILIGVKPGRNLRRELMEEVAREQYGLFKHGYDPALNGKKCVVRESKPRQWLNSPRFWHPFSGWKVAKTEGSVTTYCTDDTRTWRERAGAWWSPKQHPTESPK
jgi:hypothetical protein